MMQLGVKKELNSLFLILLLFLGQFTHADKLSIGIFDLNKFVYGFAYLYCIFLGVYRYKDLEKKLVIIFSIYVLILFQSIAVGIDNYFYIKYFDLFMWIIVTIFLLSDKNYDGKLLVLRLIYFILSIVVCGITLRYLSGQIMEREGRFLVFGPIVFARICVLGFLLSQFYIKNSIKYLLMLIFFTGLIVAQSKGPFLGFVIVECISVILFVKKERKLYMIPALIILLLIINEGFESSLLYSRITDMMNQIETYWEYGVTEGVLDNNSTSFLIRAYMYIETMYLIMEYPFGVGLGNWASFTGLQQMEYPHNIFLEVYSELGVVIGSVIFFVLLSRLKLNRKITMVSLFYLIASTVSGDILDFRYFIFFVLMGYQEKESNET